jgi:hypothetical protein
MHLSVFVTPYQMSSRIFSQPPCGSGAIEVLFANQVVGIPLIGYDASYYLPCTPFPLIPAGQGLKCSQYSFFRNARFEILGAIMAWDTIEQYVTDLREIRNTGNRSDGIN